MSGIGGKPIPKKGILYVKQRGFRRSNIGLNCYRHYSPCRLIGKKLDGKNKINRSGVIFLRYFAA